MVGSKRSSKGSKFSMKTTAVSVLSGGPPLGVKSPPTLIDKKTIDPSVIALRAKNYAAAYADPLLRQKWNMYVLFGIQQFLSLNNYVSHRAQETADGRNLHLARYYWYHLENQASVATCLIRIMGAVETALAISHPGYFDMSTIDMDKYAVSMSEKVMDMEIDLDTPSADEIVQHDNPASMDTRTNTASTSSSSLAKAASTGSSSSDKSGMRSQMTAEKHPLNLKMFSLRYRCHQNEQKQLTTTRSPTFRRLQSRPLPLRRK